MTRYTLPRGPEGDKLLVEGLRLVLRDREGALRVSVVPRAEVLTYERHEDPGGRENIPFHVTHVQRAADDLSESVRLHAEALIRACDEIDEICGQIALIEKFVKTEGQVSQSTPSG